jgi:hypothetical protein
VSETTKILQCLRAAERLQTTEDGCYVTRLNPKRLKAAFEAGACPFSMLDGSQWMNAVFTALPLTMTV